MNCSNRMMAELYQVVKQAYNASDENFVLDENAECHALSFADIDQYGNIYQVTVVISNNEEIAEVYVRKNVNTDDIFELLKLANELNIMYRGVTFLVDNDLIISKTMCEIHGNIDRVIENMFTNINSAHEEFGNIC